MSTQVGQVARHQGVGTAAADLPVESGLPSFDGAGTWLNSGPLTPATLHGKVVVVQFWTYTCINWLRTLAYVRAWSQKYRDHGLVVIGVHTPEFEFEKDLENVKRAVKAMHIDWPIATDNDYAVWQAFANHYWPALYFADAQGRIRHHRFGEGDFERSEMVIRQLLAGAGFSGIPGGLAKVEGSGPEAAADWSELYSQENYLGYERNEGFEASGGIAANKRHVYKAPSSLRLNHWGLEGDWTVTEGSVRLNQPNGRIAYQFHARDVHLVMGPAARGTAPRFRVFLDGEPARAAHGSDVDGAGAGTAGEQRMYQLIRQPTPIRDRRFEIEFLDPGAEAFCFTFG
jgi:thiol-disulfide isomerase/thioredoxin